jgi:alpha-galactosidase
MPIHYDEARKLFVLETPRTTYAFAVDGNGILRHVYWGERIGRLADLPAAVTADLSRKGVDFDWTGCLEYRTEEPFHFCEPALRAVFPDNVRGVRLAYAGHSVEKGKDHEVLKVLLRDRHYPLSVELSYTLYGGLDLVGRDAAIRNEGKEPILLEAMKSATFYVPRGLRYRLSHMAGDWGAEYGRERLMLTRCKVDIANRRGTSSGAQAVPFFALDAGGEATETSGRVWYGVLHWSGNFRITVESDKGMQTTVTAGIDDFDATWNLKPGEIFRTPQCTVGFTAGGFEKMSEALYDFQWDHLSPRPKAYAVRPVIYNSWYPYEFDVNEERILALEEKAAAIGAELFVIDDGWFVGRTDDKRGLGDWTPCPKRFPRGLRPVVDRAHELGMGFGLWVEPEMVNPDSGLYRKHPDWVVHFPTRERTTQRNQLVLNLAREDVREFAFDFIDRLIGEYGLDYLKWDMNRYFSEPGWPDAPAVEQKSLPVRFIRNLYDIWERLNAKYPNVLYENCASGGGRADYGMVAYADRINRSDNADPVDVMRLHEGFTTLFLPKTAGGAGNISPSPNGINGRVVPLRFRAHMGMNGSMSVGINLLKAPPEELEELRSYLKEFKALRPTLQDSYVYHLVSAWDNPYAIFQYVNRARTVTTMFAYGHGLHCRQKLPRTLLRGLKPEAVYAFEDGSRVSGEGLMRFGIQIDLRGDYDSKVITLRCG